MEYLKKILSLVLIFTQLVMLIGVMPARAENPVAPNYVCGQDLNSNGYLGDEGEYQSCKTATINHSAPADTFCLPGYSMQPSGRCARFSYAPINNQCPQGTYIQNGRCLKEEYLAAQAYCPSGTVKVGNVCQSYSYTPASQVCPSGSYVQNGRCITASQIEPVQGCISPYTYNPYNPPELGCRYLVPQSNKNCGLVPASQRPPGYTFSQGFELGAEKGCLYQKPVDNICSQGVMSSGMCVFNTDKGPVSLVCPSGSVVENGQCKKTTVSDLNYLCNVGTFTNGQCKVTSDAGPVSLVCPPLYIIENGQCVLTSISDTQYKCNQGGLNGTQCKWNTSENYCPIGVDNACLNNNGGAGCSSNKCIDITQNKPVDEGNVDGSMLVDDGKKNEDGVCMDQLFIFSGRGQDCKLAGIDTAYKNCCKSEGKVFTDGAGAMGTVSTAASTVSKVYGAAQEAYTYYTVAMQATGDAAVASSMAAQGFGNAMIVAFDPTSLAISIAIYFAMQYLMKACDQTSMETAMQAGSGYCHEVGTYCKKKIPLLGCVQKATSYCCFNSKLARIIHEQGRPQLKNFNGWGDAGSPQCRGFSPDEFQALDFSKIDLSEYVEDMVKKATDEIQSNVNQITQDFYEKTN
ncbi:conjugal transfer protein (plasmid) [Buttiauxella sp. 3AFRM03]|uniref:conjugal transfer protein TraN n=1 Tax=Buttiauxella sp. 3AFRM03 TaxID=2479367 RepID=UPI000EF78498|nr:conjugal transfer protein TraN [Buttiauxella sp. 3AFRM03]AYN25584.1 conjugal transfer protein [Buttiauxella sp. 3AFRM03]